MKKKVILVCSIIIIVMVVVLITINSTGVKKYHSEVLQSTIDIPNYAFCIREFESGDTAQIEFLMFGSEHHIVEQISKLYEVDSDVNNDDLNAYDFMQWSVNDKKIYNHIVLVWEK